MLSLESALLAQRLLDQTEGCYPGMPPLLLLDESGSELLPPVTQSIEYVFDPAVGEHVMVVQKKVGDVLPESQPS